MSDENLENRYPHWKDALFGNHNAVANIRCAVHYVFWHLVYGLIAVVGGIFVLGISAGQRVVPYLGPFAAPAGRAFDRMVAGVRAIANHDRTEQVAEALLVSVFGIGILLVAGFLVYGLVYHFWQVLEVLGFIVGLTVGLLGLAALALYLEDPAKSTASSLAQGARTAGERAVETPGIRRVYGECPVTFKQSPKWFDNIFPEEEV